MLRKAVTIKYSLFLGFLFVGSVSCKDNRQAYSQNAVIEQIYWLNSTFGLWQTAVRVNGEPVYIDKGIPPEGKNYSSGVLDITPFFVDGSNLVTMEVTRTETSANESNCWLSLVELNEGQIIDCDPIYIGGISQIEGEPLFGDNDEFLGSNTQNSSTWQQHYNTQFDISTIVPLRWTWQDGEVIVNFTDQDKQEILTEYHKLIDAYKSKDPRNVSQLLTRWYPGPESPTLPGGPPVNHNAIKARINSIFSRADYEVLATEDGQVEFVVGRKLVLLIPEKYSFPMHALTFESAEPVLHILIYAGASVKSQENRNLSLPYTGQSTLYFFKKNGKWHMLPQNWANEM